MSEKGVISVGRIVCLGKKKKKKKSWKQPKSPPTCVWLHESLIHSVIVKKTDIFLRVISIYLTHISPKHSKQKPYIAEEHFSTVNSIANVQKRWLTWFWYYHSRKVVSSWHGWCPACQRVLCSEPGVTEGQKVPRGDFGRIPKLRDTMWLRAEYCRSQQFLPVPNAFTAHSL